MPPPDLLFLMCDTARADAFEPWGGSVPTPNAVRIATEGRSFSRAVAPAPWTLPSTASMFSGLLPTEHGITGECFRWTAGRPSSPREAVRGFGGSWLPEALRDRGYATWAASCNGWISVWGGFDRGFDSFIQLHQRFRGGRGRWARLKRRADRFLGRMDRGGRDALDAYGRALGDGGVRPLFAFVNLMEVHTPYDPPRGYYPYPPWRRPRTRRLTGGPGTSRRFLALNAGLVEPDPGFVGDIRLLYYESARYEDWLVGRFLDVVRDRGRPTVVVLVSDHGENLGEHGLFAHNSSLHETVLHVPLALWGSRVEVGPDRVDHPVSLIELPRWLQGLADGAPVDGWSEKPLVSEYESTTRQRPIPDEVQDRLADPAVVPPLVLHAGVAIRTGSRKYVAAEDGTEALYDLATDPGEQRVLPVEREADVTAFAPHLEAWRRRRASQPRYGPGEVAEEEIAGHLRDLGYID
jgi:arylsulfatase A-like enzyme